MRRCTMLSDAGSTTIWRRRSKRFLRPRLVVHILILIWGHHDLTICIRVWHVIQKGYTPPASIESANRSPDPNQVLSKKVTRKQEAAKKQAAEKEKARRVAEGSARAA